MQDSSSSVRHIVFPRALAEIDISANELPDLLTPILEGEVEDRAQALSGGDWDALREDVQIKLGQARALYNWSLHRTSHEAFVKRLREFERALAEFRHATGKIDWILESAGKMREQVNEEVLYYVAQFSDDVSKSPRQAFERYRIAHEALARVHSDVQAAFKHLESSLKGGRPKNVAYEFVVEAALAIASRIGIPLTLDVNPASPRTETQFVRLAHSVLETFLPQDAPEAWSSSSTACAARIRRTSAWKVQSGRQRSATA